jgi:hypothetical protein
MSGPAERSRKKCRNDKGREQTEKEPQKGLMVSLTFDAFAGTSDPSS